MSLSTIFPLRPRHVITAILLVALVAPIAASGQDGDEVNIEVINVRDNVYMLVGQGGNIGLSTGADGPLIIDDQFARLTEKIVAAVATVSDQRVKFVVNTHHHGDHVGGNANFHDSGAIVVAHENVRNRMQAAQQEGDGEADDSALPVLTFSHDATFHWNGQTTHVHHVEPAHTDGDAVVYFEEANVIHMGDTFFAGRYPYIDLGSGGSMDGVIAAADYALSISNDATRIIPGHGQLAKPKDLQTYRDMLATVRTAVADAIANGKTLSETLAMKPSAAYDEKWGGGFVNPERFLTSAYNSLSANK